MHDQPQLYELSFLPPREGQRTIPEITFTTKREFLPEIKRRVELVIENCREHTDQYCAPGTTFSYTAPDLLGQVEFGHGGCGFLRTAERQAEFHVRLRGGEQLYCATLTMQLLTIVLSAPPLTVDGRRTNQLQQIDLMIRCDRQVTGYGHSVGGHASGRLTHWLCEQADAHDNVPMPGEVIQAMRQAWAAVVPDDLREWASMCGGYISPDGRFVLNCFGDACDIAIYPDQAYGEETRRIPFVQFGCHNLDTAAQQVTLLAGLAKMCELARRDE